MNNLTIIFNAYYSKKSLLKILIKDKKGDRKKISKCKSYNT